MKKTTRRKLPAPPVAPTSPAAPGPIGGTWEKSWHGDSLVIISRDAEGTSQFVTGNVGPFGFGRDMDLKRDATANLLAATPGLRRAVELLLEAYAPGAEASALEGGEDCLHSSVQFARAELRKAQGQS